MSGIQEPKLMLGRPAADGFIEKLSHGFALHSARCGPVTMQTVNCDTGYAARGYESAVRRVFGKIGVNLGHTTLPYSVGTRVLSEELERLNSDANIHGVLIFEPLPKAVDMGSVKRILSPYKDVDCVTPHRLGEFYSGKSRIVPATAAAVVEILTYYNIAIEGKRVVVVGRSDIVGKPAALALMFRNATVTICHTRTHSLRTELRRADIIVTAAGVPGLIKAGDVSSGAVIVDVGTNYVGEQLVGDVDFKGVSQKVSAITPVPRGVGPMTTVMLAANLFNLVSSGF